MLAPSAVVALFVVIAAAVGPIYPDRAFVDYRYAAHLANGQGLAYNPGEAASEGYDNVLWVLTCAALDRLGLEVPAAAPIVATLFGAFCILLLWWAMRITVSRRSALAAVCIAALSGPLAIASVAGEGITLVAALSLAIVALLSRDSLPPTAFVWAGVIAVALSTCGWVYTLVFPAALLARRVPIPRRQATISIVIFISGLAAYHAWRATTFGALVPDGSLALPSRATVSDFFILQNRDIPPFGWLYLFAVVAGVTGMLWMKRACDRVAVTTAILLAIATLPFRDPLPGLSTSAPMLLPLLIPLSGLLARAPYVSHGRAADGLVLGALMFAVLSWAVDLRIFARHMKTTHDVTFAPLGHWLAQWRPDGTMLTDAPGRLPYYSGWQANIVTAAITPGADIDLVILKSEGILDTEIAPDLVPMQARIAGAYRVLAVIRREWVRDGTLSIYARADLPRLTDEEANAFPEGLGSVVRLNR